MAAVQVDRAQSDAMNLQVLKRQDADVMEIVDTASHVVMYEFDQDNQSWKRKEVEGCLFVVKRFSSPRFQVFVNNRLSTTNMTLAIDEHLQVSSVDSFLILRCPDAAYSSGYAIYGVWFFPEEDREKILNLLLRVVQSLKEPQASVPAIAPANGSVNGKQQVQQKAQPQQQVKKVEQPQQQVQQVQEQQPVVVQAQQQQPRARSRSRNKRDDSNGRRQSGGANSANAIGVQQQQQQPTMILQRSPKNGNKAGLPPTGAPKQQEPATATATTTSSGMLPISREDGIAAGEAILGMISQNRNSGGSQQTSPVAGGRRNQRKKQQQQPQQQQQSDSSLLMPATVSTSSSPTNAESAGATPVNKEQLKQTLISLLDDSQFFDQIYHAYVDRVHLRS